MSRSFQMLITLILVGISTTSSTKPNMILGSRTRPRAWLNETKFWAAATCQAGKRRTISLHDTPKVSSNSHLRDFFQALVTNVQADCGSTMTIKFHLIDDDADDLKPSLSSYVKQPPANPPKILQEFEATDINASRKHSPLFPCKDTEIVLMRIENCVQALMNGTLFDNFHDGHHVLVFMISEETDPRRSTESLTNLFAVLLARLWQERRVLGVSFVAPFTDLGYRMWFYDPFFPNETSGVRGRIFGIGLDGAATVDRVKDLKGYTLNIGMFETTTGAVKFDPKTTDDYFPFVKKSGGYGGMDGATMALVADKMNFKVNIVLPSDGIEYGYSVGNGTLVGTIGDAANHRIDISFNSMYVKIYTPNKTETNIFSATTPVDFDRLCVIVPSAEKIPRWLRVFYCFDLPIWICLLMTQFIVSLVWYLLRKFHDSPSDEGQRSTYYRKLLLNTILLFAGVPVKLNVSQLERMFLAVHLLLGLTMMGIFTGTLYNTFTNEMRYKEMNTLKDVDESGLAIGTTSPNLYDVFGGRECNDDLEEVNSLRRKYTIFKYDRYPTVGRVAHERNVAGLSREHSFLVVKYKYVDEAGTSLLHLVKECPRAYYLAYVVPKDSVYLSRLNVLIRRLQNGGLPVLWKSVVTNKLAFEAMAKAKAFKKVRSPRAPFNLTDMQTSFFILLIGLSAATLVFIVEISYNGKRRAVKKGRATQRRAFVN